MSITLIVEDDKWRRARGLTALVKRAAALAQRRADGKNRSLTILLSTDEKLRRLNSEFRGQHKATNVLSFPADAKSYLGDVAIAYGVTAAEARASAKPFADHAAHLAVHGVLHLLGYDHETTRAARRMEPLEIAILAELGISDPYASIAA